MIKNFSDLRKDKLSKSWRYICGLIYCWTVKDCFKSAKKSNDNQPDNIKETTELDTINSQDEETLNTVDEENV